jgi:hypothetical protein
VKAFIVTKVGRQFLISSVDIGAFKILMFPTIKVLCACLETRPSWRARMRPTGECNLLVHYSCQSRLDALRSKIDYGWRSYQRWL